MPERPLLPTFLEVSCHLTGFDAGMLLGTGLLETYHDLLLKCLGEERLRGLLYEQTPQPASTNTTEMPPAMQDPGSDALTCRLIRLWYTGHWGGEMVSAAAYRGGLLWRAIGVSPPGSRPPGYGSWSQPPQSS